MDISYDCALSTRYITINTTNAVIRSDNMIVGLENETQINSLKKNHAQRNEHLFEKCYNSPRSPLH